MEAPAKIAEECKAKITGFQELLPLITAICNGGLHARHWEQIAAVVGFDVRPDEVTSLRRLLDYNIQDHIKVVMSDVPLLPLSSPYHRTLLPVSPPQLIPLPSSSLAVNVLSRILPECGCSVPLFECAIVSTHCCQSSARLGLSSLSAQ